MALGIPRHGGKSQTCFPRKGARLSHQRMAQSCLALLWRGQFVSQKISVPVCPWGTVKETKMCSISLLACPNYLFAYLSLLPFPLSSGLLGFMCVCLSVWVCVCVFVGSCAFVTSCVFVHLFLLFFMTLSCPQCCPSHGFHMQLPSGLHTEFDRNPKNNYRFIQAHFEWALVLCSLSGSQRW